MNVQKIIREIDALEPFPQTAFQLIDLVADESRSISEVSDLVKMDANLASNVLRLANSAFFGLKQQVDSIDRAVRFLGGQLILEIALFSMTSRTFSSAQEGYALQKGELWQHSMVSAIFAREIAKQYELKCLDVVFTAGLIKDIGKVILNRYMVEATEEIDKLIAKHNCSFFDAEKSILGIDHAELSAMAFEKWHFPEKLVHIVRNHHLQKTPVIAPRETCTVYLADTVCSMLGIGAGKDGLNYPFSDEILLRYFDIQNFEALVSKLFAKARSVKELVQML